MIDKIIPIIDQFQIAGTTQSVVPIEVGHINETYKVTIQNGQVATAFVLQKINTHVFKKPVEVMENIAKVGHFLQGRGYPKEILTPLQTFDNQYFIIDKDKSYWRIFPFVENTKTFNEVSSADQAYAAAYTFGEYARYLNDFAADQLHYTIPDFHNTNLRYQQFFNSAKAAKGTQKKEALESIKELHKYRYLLGAIRDINLPLRVVHSDTKINNILFDKHTGESVCVIDLDTLMPGTLIYDYGDMVRTFTPTVDENSSQFEQIIVRENILKALTEGYLDGLDGSLSFLEEKLLLYGARLITFEQALRFLTDYLKGNVYYKVAYETQNLVRAKNQICLLKDLVRY